MNFKWKHVAVLSLLSLIPWNGSAQMEKITDATYQEWSGKLPTLQQAAKNPYLKTFLGSIGSKTPERALITAARVAADVNGAKEAFTGNVVYYAVPAMSNLMRLADTYPLDGSALAPVRIFSAQNEYEPGSFLLYPLEDLGKVELKLTPFKNAKGTQFPADKLDLKVIKIWYQNGNGWYNYFGDTELKLIPELLLNDEDLIKVDTEKVQNYARLTEKDGSVSYQWMTPPKEIDRRIGWPSYRSSYFRPFSPMKENFSDAPTLKPVTLNKGEFKQFFLTVRTEKGQEPGVYKGAVDLVKQGKKIGSVPVAVRVLPFELGAPGSYANPDKEFLISSYAYTDFSMIMWENGGNYELMKKQYDAWLRNLAAHNQTMFITRHNVMSYEGWKTLEMFKDTGMRLDYVMGGSPSGRDPLEWEHNAKIQKAFYHKLLGHNNIFLSYGDEPSAASARPMLPLLEHYQKHGFKFYIAAKTQVFYVAGYLYDFFNTAYDPTNQNATEMWNEVGKAWVAWYAVQHVGPENPAYNRCQNGMAPYLANYSALCNYAHHFGSYNDRSSGYKPMVFLYGAGHGVIDTLQWEGFREGVDDIRYATVLKRLTAEATVHKDMQVQYAGRRALQYLAEIKAGEADLNEVRLNMVQHILKLRKLLNK